jgi:hypothetical protein
MSAQGETYDAEVRALMACFVALRDLTSAEQERVLWWLRERFAADAAAAPHPVPLPRPPGEAP